MSPLLGYKLFLWIIHKENHNPPREPSAHWWVLKTANAAETNGLTRLPKHGRARANKIFGHPSDDLLNLLRFRNLMPSAPTRGSRTFIIIHTYIHTTHEGVAEVSQIFLRDTHVLPKLVSYEEHCSRDRW
jgi:hypothetical protein